MTKRLVIAEAATKIEFLKAYYGLDTDSILCQWPLFTTSYQTVSGNTTKDIFHFDPLPAAEELTTTLNAEQYQEIILAFDTDAKGELISWQIGGFAAQLGAATHTIHRLKPTGFSSHELDSAMQVIAPPDSHLGQSTYSRHLFDEYLGRHLQRLLGTDRGPGNLLLRHHSLTILFLLVENQQGQSAAPQTMKWQLTGTVDGTKQSFPATLSIGKDVPIHGLFSDQDKVLSLASKLEKSPFDVDIVTRSPLSIPPPAAYHLPELTQDALLHLGLNPIQVTQIITRLYHGIVHQGQTMGLITSPSPGTPPPSAATLTSLRQQVSTLYGESNLREQATLDSGSIVPLFPHLDGLSLNQPLSQDELSLYDLIRSQALASQMKPALGESFSIDFLVNSNYGFQSHYNELIDPGFLKALPAQLNKWQSPFSLSEIAKGQQFRATLNCQPSSLENQGVEPYTIESLLAELADFSIAADPATIRLIGDLAALGYLGISEQGLLKATNQANQVVAILSRAFPQMQGVNLSAYIEQTINEALTSRKDLTFALRQFDQTLMLHGKALIKTKTPARVSTTRSRASSTIIKQATPTPVAIETDTSPIATNAPLPPAEAKQPTTDEAIIKSSHPASQTLETRPPTPPPQDEQSITIEIEDTDAGTPLSDKFLSHDKPEPESALETNTPPEDLLKLFTDSVSNKSAVADATNQRPEHTPQPPLDSKEKNCPACGKSLVIKQDQFGTYWGCSGFPTCRYSENTQEFPCPLCGHALTRKQTPTGKDFFSCAHNDCQFMSWSTPHYLPCGLCNSPYLVEKIVQGGTQLRCPRAGCSYGQPLPEQSTENRSSPTGTSQKKIMVRRTVPGTGTAAAGTKKVRIVRRKS